MGRCAGSLGTVQVAMSTVPSGRSISWLPTIDTSTAPVLASVGTLPVPCGGGLPNIIPVPTLPPGGYMGEGLLPIPGKICRKILGLEFVEVRELMPVMSQG